MACKESHKELDRQEWKKELGAIDNLHSSSPVEKVSQ